MGGSIGVECGGFILYRIVRVGADEWREDECAQRKQS